MVSSPIIPGDDHPFPLLTPDLNISCADWLPSNTPTIWVCHHLSNKASLLSSAAACTVNWMYLVVIAKLLVSVDGIRVIRSCQMAQGNPGGNSLTTCWKVQMSQRNSTCPDGMESYQIGILFSPSSLDHSLLAMYWFLNLNGQWLRRSQDLDDFISLPNGVSGDILWFQLFHRDVNWD